MPEKKKWLVLVGEPGDDEHDHWNYEVEADTEEHAIIKGIIEHRDAHENEFESFIKYKVRAYPYKDWAYFDSKYWDQESEDEENDDFYDPDGDGEDD